MSPRPYEIERRATAEEQDLLRLLAELEWRPGNHALFADLNGSTVSISPGSGGGAFVRIVVVRAEEVVYRNVGIWAPALCNVMTGSEIFTSTETNLRDAEVIMGLTN